MTEGSNGAGVLGMVLLVLAVMVAMVVAVASAASMAIAKLCLWIAEWYVARRAARASRAAATELGQERSP